MSPVSRKRRKEPSRPCAPRTPSVEPAGSPLEDDVAALGAALEGVLERAFRGAKGLARAKDPLEAEIAASTLLALWSDYDLPGQPDPAALLGQAMIGFLESRATPDALALIQGFGAVELRILVDAHLATRRLEEAGVAPPSWVDVAGRSLLESAWLATDVYGDQDFLVGRFSYAGEAPHDLAVLVDHNVLDIARDVAVLRATSNLRSRWERQADITVLDISAQEYSDRLADALDNIDRTWDPPLTDAARTLRPLAESRRIFLPRPKPLKRRAVSRAARDRLYAAFRRSGHAAALGRDTQLARIAIDFTADFYDDALHWSPIVVELFLVDWLPRKIFLSEEEVERLPEVLRAWLRFVGEQRGFADRLVGEMLAAVRRSEGDFREAMGDSSSFGPAKSIALRMQEEGVDMHDSKAIQAWIDEFNARPLEEREEATGGPLLH